MVPMTIDGRPALPWDTEITFSPIGAGLGCLIASSAPQLLRDLTPHMQQRTPT
jgi:hypothetical protein